VTSTRSDESFASSSARSSPSCFLLDGLLDRLASRVERHAGLTVAHVAERELQVALAPEVADARLVELRERPGRGDGSERLVL